MKRYITSGSSINKTGFLIAVTYQSGLVEYMSGTANTVSNPLDARIYKTRKSAEREIYDWPFALFVHDNYVAKVSLVPVDVIFGEEEDIDLTRLEDRETIREKYRR